MSPCPATMPRPLDPGVYLIQVIQQHFPRRNFYKHLDKVFADELPPRLSPWDRVRWAVRGGEARLWP